jgi:hypothetical protein
LAIHAKGGESISPKAKGPHHHLISKLKLRKGFKMMNFSIDILLYSKGGESSIFKIGILKPSWTLRGGFLRGSFVLVKGKAFETGRKFQILKMLLKILFIYLWPFAKGLLKRIYKRICKKQNMWCKRGPKC